METYPSTQVFILTGSYLSPSNLVNFLKVNRRFAKAARLLFKYNNDVRLKGPLERLNQVIVATSVRTITITPQTLNSSHYELFQQTAKLEVDLKLVISSKFESANLFYLFCIPNLVSLVYNAKDESELISLIQRYSTTLRHISLKNDFNIHSKIISHICTCSNLESLRISNSNLIDINAFSQFFELTSLKRLALDLYYYNYNHLSSVAKLNNLRELAIESNCDIESISILQKLPNVKKIEVTPRSFTVDMQNEMMKITQLTKISFSGIILRETKLNCEKGSRIVSLDLTKTQLSGITLSDAHLLHNLRSLNLSNNRLEQIVGEKVCSLKSICELDLSMCIVMFDTMRLTNLPLLTKLNMHKVDMDMINFEMFKKLDLTELNMSKTGINNYGFFNLIGQKNLIKLNISHNYIKDGIGLIKYFTKLQVLEMNNMLVKFDNELESIGELVNLRELNLSELKLKEFLEDEVLSRLNQLRVLNCLGLSLTRKNVNSILKNSKLNRLIVALDLTKYPELNIWSVSGKNRVLINNGEVVKANLDIELVRSFLR